jgi:hypothetical protein
MIWVHGIFPGFVKPHNFGFGGFCKGFRNFCGEGMGRGQRSLMGSAMEVSRGEREDI